MGIFDFLGFKKNLRAARHALSVDTQRKIEEEWLEIDSLIKVGKPSTLREAVTRADKTLDLALTEMLGGANLGECLKLAKNCFTSTVYNQVWQAHKVRNALAHEVGYEPPHFMTKEALENFRLGLRELGLRL